MKRMLALLLCTLLFAEICTGCDKKEKTNHNNEDSQNVQSTINIEPITIPKEEWTLDTICQVTYINEKNLQVPCTIRNLGDEFNIISFNDDKNFSYNERLHRATGYLTYNGAKVAVFVVEDCNSIDNILDSPLKYITSGFELEYFPISVNGVAVGDDYETAKENLYFMDVSDYSDDEKGFYILKKEIDNFSINCVCSDWKVTDFSIWFNDRT